MTGTDDTIHGRERELARVEEAVAEVSAGARVTLVVHGEAGIGKTTLVGAVSRRGIAAGLQVLEGHCVDIDSAIPLGPVLQALDGLEQLGADPGPPPDGMGNETSFDRLRAVLTVAARRRPVLLIIEDLHWADPSTQDFVLGLARSFREPLLLVLTVRDADVTDVDPLRRRLAELEGRVGVSRLDVGPLDPTAIRAMVEGRTSTRADPRLVADLCSRAEGNPLFIEAILADGGPGVPASLRDLLLLRTRALPADATRIVHAASVGGTRIDLPVLATVVDLPTQRFDDGLRVLLAAHLIDQVGGGLRFHHALIRDAVHADLLPHERSRLHAAFGSAIDEAAAAGAVVATPGIRELSQSAHHWHASGDREHALVSATRAGMAAHALGAGECEVHLRRAVELWEVVPEAAAVTGLTLADLCLALARPLLGWDGALAYLEKALDLLDEEARPRQAVRILSTYATVAAAPREGPSVEDAATRALAISRGSATVERLMALRAGAVVRGSAGDPEAALALLDEALDVADEVGSEIELSRTLFARTDPLLDLGRYPEGIDAYRRSAEHAASDGHVGEAAHVEANLAYVLMMQGEVDAGVALAQRGRERMSRRGLMRRAAFFAEQEWEALLWRGRFDEADTLFDVALEPDMVEHRLWPVRCQRLQAQGRFIAAAPLESAVFALSARQPLFPTDEVVGQHVEQLCGVSDFVSLFPYVQALLDATEDSGSVIALSSTAYFSALSLSAALDSGVEVPRELVSGAATLTERADSRLTADWANTLDGLRLRLANAYGARLAGRRGPELVEPWTLAVEVAGRFGQFVSLRPRLELARALLEGGGRDEGRTLLVDCWSDAVRMGAGHLERRTVALGRRHRVSLRPGAVGTGPRARLTPREDEVLDLIESGATNREIATRLYISEKTVSIHVSHVLAKLEVKNRGEAASVVRRSG